jgi:hypothetical protein
MTNSATAPWTEARVLALNLQQTATHQGAPAHPYTCPARGDGKHGTEGGDLGVLIATQAGWVCPHCSHTQNWVHEARSVLQPIAMIGPAGIESIGPTLEQRRATLATLIDAYEALEATGAKGSDVMLRCLRTQLDVLVRPQPALSMWVVYDRPTDYPGEVVARRFEIVGGTERPTQDLLRASSLPALRRLAPPGLTAIPRQPGDDPVIAECWL